MKQLSYLLSTLVLLGGQVIAADQWGLASGSADLKSAGALAFGPENILFVGDTQSASVYAIEAADIGGDASGAKFNITDLSGKVSDVLGSKATINDLAVHPKSGTVFLSATAGEKPAIVQIDSAGKISEVGLGSVRFAKAVLADAPEDKVVQRGRRRSNPRHDAITDLAFFEGKVLVSGLRDGAAPSSVREISFPFAKSDRGVGVQIFHAAHGREEDYSAMRTFVPLLIDGEPNLLAAYVCTPLVKIPLKELEKAGEKLKATTVAELGNHNRPLDMISYSKDGSDYLLLSNSARGVMKITTAGLSENDGLTDRVRDGGQAGQSYETIESLKGVVQMDKLGDDRAVVLVDNNGSLDLKTVALP